MPSYKDYYSGDFLTAKDVGSDSDKTEVESVGITEFGDAKKIVLGLKGFKKKLALNKTNAKRMEELANTEDYEKWIGTKIQLYKIITTYGKEEVDAIRIKGTTPENKGDA